MKRLAERIADTESDVLIVGESGTGKEVLAQAIHNASRRAGGRFVAVNCATLSKDLISSELFGYTGGAFTGANKEGKSVAIVYQNETIWTAEDNFFSLYLLIRQRLRHANWHDENVKLTIKERHVPDRSGIFRLRRYAGRQ